MAEERTSEPVAGEQVGTLVDTATGYTVMVSRLNQEENNIQYTFGVYSPISGKQLDGVESVPLRSDGRGHLRAVEDVMTQRRAQRLTEQLRDSIEQARISDSNAWRIRQFMLIDEVEALLDRADSERGV